MKIRLKVIASAAALALTAMAAAGGQPASAKTSKPSVLAKAPPTYLIGANGSSIDGFWSDPGNGSVECFSCDDFDYCGCFTADSNSGGGGSFQMNGAKNAPMAWAVEIDYVDSPSNYLPTAESSSVCNAASGFGVVVEGTGRKENSFLFETTGLVCDTASLNDTYTGSYVLEDGVNAYSNATGSGVLNLGMLNGAGPNYVNQIQFTGNLGQ
jgi:hypothetical protein